LYNSIENYKNLAALKGLAWLLLGDKVDEDRLGL
jgi:hypothetical protein